MVDKKQKKLKKSIAKKWKIGIIIKASNKVPKFYRSKLETIEFKVIYNSTD
jgi:hypothetical protein